MCKGVARLAPEKELDIEHIDVIEITELSKVGCEDEIRGLSVCCNIILLLDALDLLADDDYCWRLFVVHHIFELHDWVGLSLLDFF